MRLIELVQFSRGSSWWFIALTRRMIVVVAVLLAASCGDDGAADEDDDDDDATETVGDDDDDDDDDDDATETGGDDDDDDDDDDDVTETGGDDDDDDDDDDDATETGGDDDDDDDDDDDATDDDRLALAVEAAKRAADTESRCDDIADKGAPRGFYWEIGDVTGVLASGQRGDYSFDTVKTVASATKLVTAAYFAERFAVDAATGFDATTGSHLNFTSGYVVTEQTCADDATVESCHEKFGGDAVYDATKSGRFYYGPDHMQKLAAGFADLAPLNVDGLAAEYRKVLGLDAALSFKYPALASGIEGGPTLFREFLQKLLRGDYRLRGLLGEGAVCTIDCGAETSSPVEEPWQYGFGHWIENGCGEGTCDGAMMGLGATGFYAWIDASKRYYGILGRWQLPVPGQFVPVNSAFCGQKIRAAFLDTLRESAVDCAGEGGACAAGFVCCADGCATTCR